MNLLDFMGEHPVLTVALAIIVFGSGVDVAQAVFGRKK